MKHLMTIAAAVSAACATGPLSAQTSAAERAVIVPSTPGQSPGRAVLRQRWELQPNCRGLEATREMKGPGETMPQRASKAVPFDLTATSLRRTSDYKVTATICIGNQDRSKPVTGRLTVVLATVPADATLGFGQLGGWRVTVPTPIQPLASRCATSTRTSREPLETVSIADVKVPDGPVFVSCSAPVKRLDSPLDDRALSNRPSTSR